MGETQLLAELQNVSLEKERKEKEIGIVFKAVKDSVINVLGLNIMPLEDPDTGLFRRPADNELLPLVGYLANPEILKVVAERTEILFQQEQAEEAGEALGHEVQEMSPEDLDSFINEDLLFVDNDLDLEKHLVWNSPATKMLLDQVVKTRDDVENKNKSTQVKESEKSTVIIESDEACAPSNEKEAHVKITESE